MIESKLNPFLLPKIELSFEQDERISSLWTYPSDHLPVCGKVNQYRIGTLNILHTKCIGHTINNRKGWENSGIAKEHKILSLENGLTKREEHICKIIEKLFSPEKNGQKPLDILCLQECSDKMYQSLKLKLENLNERSFQISSADGGHDNRVAIIFDTTKFSIETEKATAVFKRYLHKTREWVLDDWRPVIDIRLKENLSFLKHHTFIDL